MTTRREKSFWSRVDMTLGCWLWRGRITRDGYPVLGSSARAHRYAYELLVGPIPEGLTIDHLCRVRHCVNPAHMEPVTRAENTRRGEPATRTHCIHGHPFTPENTYARLHAGRRQCRACNREAVRRYSQRKKAAA